MSDQDTELSPNRSTYHSGATGTRALYDFLSESGYPVMRWREVPAQLLADTRQKVQTFVIIGDTALSIDEDEAASLLLWVQRGGQTGACRPQTGKSGFAGISATGRFRPSMGSFPV